MKEALRRIAVPLVMAGLLALALFAGRGMSQTPSAQAQGTTPTTATSTSPTHRAQIDFGAPVGDAYLTTLLDRYEAKPILAYMTVAGFFGAHRAATATAPAVFIASARAETVAGFSNGAGGGMTTRAHDFVGRHTAQDVEGDPEVMRRAGSLLGLHARLEAARANASSDSALIHAVEVHGSEEQLRLLGAERRVVGFEIAAIGSEVRWPRPPLMPGPTGQIGRPSIAFSGDSRELHDRLSRLSER